MFAHGKKRRRVLEDRLHDGYFYSVNSTKGDTMYLECKEKNVKSCSATAKIHNEQFTLGKAHNHPISSNLDKEYRFKEALYTAVTSSLCRDPIGAVQVPFQSVKEAMLQWRRDSCPPEPRSWEDYKGLLRMEEWQRLTSYDGGRLSVPAVRAVDGSISIVYGDVEFLRSINPVHLHIDATFKVCPRRPKVLQLVTIMAEIDDANLPIAWALMERKTKDAYLAVLQHFSTMLV